MEAVIEKAGVERLDGWMALVRCVRDEFPGLETEELLMEHRRTVERFMRRGEAICAVQDGQVVGALLYSVKKGLLCFLAVHPDARRRGIAREMVQRMLREMPGEVRVQTFCEGDERGRGAALLPVAGLCARPAVGLQWLSGAGLCVEEVSFFVP